MSYSSISYSSLGESSNACSTKYTSLSFRTGAQDIRDAKYNLENDVLPVLEKHMAADFIFRKVATYYKFSIKELDKVTEVLKTVFPNLREYRYAFIHYNWHYDPMMLNIADHFFYNHVFNEFSSSIILSQFLIRYGTTEHTEKACKTLQAMAEDVTLSIPNRSNIADILMRCHVQKYKKIGEALLEKLRNEESGLIKTVYTDSQNVHSASISKGVLRILSTINTRLFDHFKIPLDTVLDINNAYNVMLKIMKEYVAEQLKDIENIGNKCEINKSILRNYNDTNLFEIFERIQHDTADICGETVLSSFRTIFLFIEINKYRPSRLYRLLEELIDGGEYCATGYISRFVSAIQGYDDIDDEISLTISEAERIKAIVTQLLQKEIMNNIDDVSDTLMDEIQNPTNFICKFIIDTISASSVLKNEDMNEIVNALNSFLNKKIFSLTEGELKYNL